MTPLRMDRRTFLTGAAATLALRPAHAQSNPATLTARMARAQIAPPGYPETQVWTYDGLLPGTELRLPQGARLTRRLVNELDVPTSVHWHGIRIDNTMDGVAGLTQDPVPPGGTFDYDFVLPDAGTYWYHAHTNSMEQVARGLSGPLIVEEPDAPDVDRDLVLMLDDWLLDPDTAQIADGFDHPMTLSHGGRLGNLTGTNGRYGLRMAAARNERLRLRLINAANARIFVLRLAGMQGWQVALDGMPLDAPEPADAEIVLAPAQRVDLIVDVTADGPVAALERLDQDGAWRAQVGFDLDGTASANRRPAPAALPPNPRMDRPQLAGTRLIDMPIEGGAMGRMGMMQMRDMMSRGQFWLLGGQSGPGDDPAARIGLGETVRVSMLNDTAFPHGMHLHGMHFRAVEPDGGLGPMRDTLIVDSGERREIAFVADNPGKWLFHCHMLGHAASGMTRWFEVA